MKDKTEEAMTSISYSDNAADMLARQVETSMRQIEFLDAVAAAGTVGELLTSEDGAEWFPHAEDYGSDADYVEVLDAEVLEVVGVWRGSDRLTAELDHVELLMCYGGPTVRATINSNGQVTVRGTWWSSDPVERVTFAGTLADWLFEEFGAGYR